MAHDFKIKRISGTATVIDDGKIFTTYQKFAKAAEYEEAVYHFTNLKEGEKVRLLAKGEHENPSFGTVYVIETDKGVRHLIGHKGIKIDEPAQIPEQTYAEIAEPFGKQFRDAIREAYARGYADGKQISEMLREEYTQEKVCDVQRQRDRIIEKAKDEVEALKSDYDGLYEVNNHQSKLSPYVCTADFIVNKDKRTIVALLLGKHSSKVRAKGIAKCVPGDCFNIHIGKAVALRKALGKSIDDYMNVPNPTEVRVGDIVVWKHSPDELYKVTKVDGDYYNFIRLDTGRRYKDAYYKTLSERIIDDSREVSE